MGNNVTLIPKQPARHSLLTNTENVVYMPLASKHSHGIVKIGDGLNVTADSLVYVDFESGWFADTLKKLDDVINNDIKIGNANGGFGTKNTEVSEDGSIAIGNNAKAKYYNGVAIGNNSNATTFSSIAVGTKANGDEGGIGIGSNSNGYGEDGVALGNSAKSNNAIQIGRGTNHDWGTVAFYSFQVMKDDGQLKTNDGTKNAPKMREVASKEFVAQKIADLVNSAPETLDTLGEIAKALQDNHTVVDTLNNIVATKPDKDYVDNVISNSVTSVLNTEV